jgi:hypothetical protein
MNTVDLDTVLSVILTVALRRCDAEGNSLALLDPTRHDLAFGVMAGPAKVEEWRIVAG